MESAPKRLWYRLHWVTWLVIDVVAVDFVYVQMAEQTSYGRVKFPGELNVLYYYGWPFIYNYVGFHNAYRTFPERSEWLSSLLLDLLLSALIIVVVGVTIERLKRRQRQ